MKFWKRIASYILVAALASAATFGICAWTMQPERSKLDEVEDLLLDKFIGESDQTKMEDAAAAAMVLSLGDRWSHYMSAEEYSAYRERMNNSYVGIGITIVVREDGAGFDIRKVEPTGPAAEAGILAGDLLIRAEGQDVVPLGTTGTKEIIQGPEGTQVNITVLRNGEELTFAVTRRQIITPPATGRMLPDGIGLVTIENFNKRSAEDSIAAIEDLLEQGAWGIIFDLRYNPGGYADELVDLLDYLLPEGELFRRVDFRGDEMVDMSDAACLNIPMVVMVNGDTYSAAEFFAAALSEYGVATVVGMPTTGKGYFQTTYKLSDNSAVTLSVGKYFTPNGISLAEVGGIVPDVVVEVDELLYNQLYADLVADADDPQLAAAIEALKAR